jgi:hypothetical protein
MRIFSQSASACADVAYDRKDNLEVENQSVRFTE